MSENNNSENPFKKIPEEEKKISSENNEKNSWKFSKQVSFDEIPESWVTKTKRSILWIVVSLIVLALFLSVLLIFILVIWWPNNPLLDLVWIQASQIQDSLLSFTKTFFVIAWLLLLLISLVFLFLGVYSKNNKKNLFVTSWVFWWLVLLVIVIFFPLYNYINSFDFWVNVKAEIEIQLQNWSKDLTKITTPAILDLSILNWILNEERLWKEVESIFWDFNDDWDYDYKWIEANMSHEFNTPWNKKIVAILNFKDWTNQSYEKIFNIKDWSFWVDVQSWTAPLKVTFNAWNIVENSKNWISEFRWYFDWWENPDLVTSKSILEHTFKKVWKYNVVMVSVDSKNNVKQYKKTIEVLDSDSSSNLISNISVFPWEKWEAPFKVKLSWENSVSKKWEIVSYKWSFWEFDKEISWLDSVKTFEKPWTYEVKLTVENEYWEKNFSRKTILVTWVETVPVAKISSNLKENVFNVPFNLELSWSDSTDENNDIIKYSWDFDWNWIADAFWENVEKEIRDSWDYRITLIVEDSKWNKSEEFIEVQWKEAVKAIISTDKESWTAPLVILFDASFSRVDSWDKIVNYSWDFWDWSLSEFSSAQKRHKFEDPWVYDVVLVVSTDNWKSFKTNKKIFIREESVQACFWISKNETWTNSEIQFSSQCSSWEIKSWNWDFWDWKISYQRNPIHAFKNSWSYTVILQITDYKNNVSEFRKEIKIN